ncbi:hypothetical protein [Streptomyces sp. NPDC058674]|uniref:hypothetical protein n=1 Tax=Streptomyces sp. NPDC058674 TaxID=3346592 RepID=UPI003659D0FC
MSRDVDFRKNVTAKGGATWGAGHLYLTLSAEEGKNVIVEKIQPSAPVPTRIGPPAWIAVTQGGCGDVYGRVFEYDLDKAFFADRGVIGGLPPDGKEAKTNPLGAGFIVSSDDPAIVRIDATACKGNYEWGVLVDYSSNGKSYRREVGPFRSMGVLGKDTVGYTPDPATQVFGAAGPPPQQGVLCP